MTTIRIMQNGAEFFERLSSAASDVLTRVRPHQYDTRMPHLCPQCFPDAKAPFFIDYCGDHGAQADAHKAELSRAIFEAEKFGRGAQ